jgi:hypothetical protein
MPHLNFVVAFKTITLLMGALITYFAYRAYSRTDERALGALAVGFGIVTIGAFLAGVVDQALGGGQRDALLLESALTMVGFGVILYSLYAE